MKKYIESLSRMNSIALSSCNNDEIDRYSESDIFWSPHKNGNTTFNHISKGEIYQFEFGKSFVPEMAYEHRGIVIGHSQKLLYVLPIYSYKPSPNSVPPLHIKDNPSGKSDLYLLKVSEFNFLKHDSVVKLNDIRTVSKARIKYSHHVSIPADSDTFLYIESAAFKRYFPSISFEFDRIKADHQNLLYKVNILQQQIQVLNATIDSIKHQTESQIAPK